HLRWTRDTKGCFLPLFERRVNRQWLPETWAETGGIIGARLGRIIETGSRIHDPVALLELDPVQGLDIDDYADWAVAEYYAGRKSIVIRADAAPQLGMGHVFRSLALAHELSSHQVTIATRCDGDYALGADYLRRSPYDLELLSDETQFVLYCRRR